MPLSLNPSSFSGFSLGTNYTPPQIPLSTPVLSVQEEATMQEYIQRSSPGADWEGINDELTNVVPPNPSLISSLGGATSGLSNANFSLTGDAVQGAYGPLVDNLSDSFVGNLTENMDSYATGDIATGLSSQAAAFNKPAGQSGDPASMARAANIAAGGEVLSTELFTTTLSSSTGKDWRVKIDANFGLFMGGPFLSRLEATGGLVFPFTPTITLSSTANYSNLGFTHNNYPFMAYQNSQVDDITISGQFSVETSDDAEYWIAMQLFLRAATKMFFGSSAEVGNPPPICHLNGYGQYVFDNMSCVIKNSTINFSPDVDYILYEKGKPTWVPAFSEISVQLAPIYSRETIREFSLQDFGAGNLKGFG